MCSKRVFTGRNVVLSDGTPRPATVIVDTNTGKITDILDGTAARADFADIGDADWIDAGDKHILPGIVEYVQSPPPRHRACRSYVGTRHHRAPSCAAAARTST